LSNDNRNKSALRTTDKKIRSTEDEFKFEKTWELTLFWILVWRAPSEPPVAVAEAAGNIH
jgi:hypothetical protein